MKRNKFTSIPRNWLIWEWLLDWNALDTNDGTKVDWTATNVTYSNTNIGYQKQKWIFNGSSSYISIPSTAVNNLSSWTISVWVKRNVINVQHSFFDKLQIWVSNHIQFMYEWIWWVWDNKIRFNIHDQILASSSAITDIANFIHWTWTWSASWMQLFKNWILDNSNWLNAQLPDYTLNNINIWQVLWDAWMNWNIQWVRVYNRVLSQSEITNLYHEWLRKLWLWSDDILKDCIAYYDFNWDANDVVWGNNWAVTWATLATDKFWIANRAYSFSWTSQYILTWSTIALPSAWFTVLQWVNPSNLTANSIYSCWNFVSSWAPKFSLSIKRSTSPNYPSFNIWAINGNTYDAVWSSTLATNTRSLIWWTFTWDATSNWIKFYKNWVLDWQNTFPVVTVSSDNKLYIWWVWAWWAIDNLFTWNSWEVIIINRVLSEDEMKEFYNLSSDKYLYQFKKTLPQNLKDWLQLWIPLDISWATAYDASWNWNNWTLISIPTISRIWQHKLVNLNWSSQYIDSNKNLSWLSISNSFTFTALINSGAVSPSGYPSWIIDSDIDINRWQLLYITPSWWVNRIAALLNFTDSSQVGIIWPFISLNKWYMSTLTYDWNIIKLYINWKLYNSSSVSKTPNWTWNLLIWRDYYEWDANRYFNWKISNPMIWNKALTAKEIEQLYYSQFIN